MRIAVDVGHYAVKAHLGSSITFPALVVPAPAVVDLGPLAGRDPRVTLREDGGSMAPFWIGEDAAQLGVPLWTRDKADDPLSRVLLYDAFRRLGLANGPVAVAVGLPLSWYARHHEQLAASLLGRRVTLEASGATHRWTVTAVRVLPQGVAAALTALDQGLMAAPGLYALVDVGYRTVDVVVIEVDANRRPHGKPQWSTTLDLGWHIIDDAVIRGLRAAYPGADFLPSQVQGTQIRVFGQRVDLTRWRTPAIDMLGQRLSNAVQTNLGDIWAQLQGVVLVGGGGAALHRVVSWDGLPVSVPERPALANVLGYWAAIRNIDVPDASSVPIRTARGV
jgi:plasmid segregation protein ParM